MSGECMGSASWLHMNRALFLNILKPDSVPASRVPSSIPHHVWKSCDGWWVWSLVLWKDGGIRDDMWVSGRVCQLEVRCVLVSHLYRRHQWEGSPWCLLSMLKGSSEMSLGLGMEAYCLVSFIMRSAKRVLQRMGGLFGLKDLVKSVKSRLRYLLNYRACYKSTSL